MNKKVKTIVAAITIIFSTSIFAAINDLHKAVEDNNIKKINEILEKDATLLTAFDDQGNTPIHKAIIENKSASLQSFMDYKKVINMQIANSNGDTPLVFSIKNNKYNSILFILDNGINPFYKDKKEKNSLDYVKIFGDNTTKKIYNDYYERNKDKIKQLQENYKSPLDLSLFKENTEGLKKTKTTTVQDLLIANKNKKEKETTTDTKTDIYDKEELIKIKSQIENINIDKGIILGLEDKLKNLEDNNKLLKRKLRFKENTGKEELTATEEVIVGSLYAGIYEQQVMFKDNLEDLKVDLFDQYTVIKEGTEDELKKDKLKNNTIDNLIEKSNNYLEEKNRNLNLIQKDIEINENIVKNKVEENKENEILLPIGKLPENTVIVNYVESEDEIIKSDKEIEEKENEIETSIKILNVIEKDIPIVSLSRKTGTPEFNIEINKNKIMNSKIMPLIVLFLIFFVMAIVFMIVLFKSNKR